jgi:CRISPR system Cascade subunit CasE
VDSLPDAKTTVLVQSSIKPDWEYAFHNADYLLAAPFEIKSYDPQFSEGQKFRFRLAANPTRKIDTKSGPDGNKNNGRRVPVRAEELVEWLARKAAMVGFSFDENSITIEPSSIHVNKIRNGNGQSLRCITFSGPLQIKDPLVFREVIIKGIGPGKAYGFGMLSVAPINK